MARPSVTSDTAHDAALVFWLSVCQLISWGSVFYGFAVFLGPVEQALQMGRAESSLAFSLALLAEGLMAFPIGRWIDQGHERAVMTLGSVCMGLALWLHGLVQHPLSFYAVWLLLGVGMAATLYTPVFAVVTRRFPTDFRRAIITMTFLGGLASTVFIPLMAWLIDAMGWRHALWVLAALHLLVCAPLHAHLLKNAPATSLRVQGETASEPLGRYLREPTFWLLGVFVVMLLGVTSALPPHMVSLLRESGLSETWVIAIPASIGLLQVLGRLWLYVYERRLDVHQANRWIPCLIPLGLLILLVSPSGHLLGALLFVLLYGVGNGLLTIVKGTAMAEYVSRTHMGSLNGALGLPLALSRASAPLLMGLLWSADKGYSLGLAVLLLACLVGVAALWWAQARALRQRTR
jgi:predicted MFS family arabinose efflux permease